MARPPKEIKWDLVIRKMQAGCTAKQIFSSEETQMDSDTFYRRFKEEFGCSFGDYSVGSSQIGIGDLLVVLHSKALQGNITALLFLAKVRAGMREPDTINTISPNQLQIDHTQLIMELENKITVLEAKLADKRETE